MTFADIINPVKVRVEELGVECRLHVGKRLTEKKIAKVEEKLKLRLPAELREFYLTVGNGLVLYWSSDAEPDAHLWGSLNIPNLEDELVAQYQQWREIYLYSPEEAEKYGFPYTDDPELAKRTAARMWHWLPLLAGAGNGDQICFDLGDPSCPVIFHKHDWLDGGTGDDGHRFGDSFKDFLIGWGSVCFQNPVNCFWTPAFLPGGGVDWKSKSFRDPFRVAISG